MSDKVYKELDAYYMTIESMEGVKITPEQKEWYERQAHGHQWFTPWHRPSRWARLKRWLWFRWQQARRT